MNSAESESHITRQAGKAVTPSRRRLVIGIVIAVACIVAAVLACAFALRFELASGTYALFNKAYTSDDPELALVVSGDGSAKLTLRGNELSGKLKHVGIFDFDQVTLELSDLAYEPANYNFGEGDRVDKVLIMVPRSINDGSIEGEWRIMVEATIGGQDSAVSIGGELKPGGVACGGFALYDLFDSGRHARAAYTNVGTWSPDGEGAWRVVGKTGDRGWRIVISNEDSKRG